MGTELAAGVLRPASAAGEPVEVICAAPSGSARGADADAASLRVSLNAKKTRVGASTALLRVISRSSVREGSAGTRRFVRGTLYDRPRQQAGVALTAFDINALQALLDLQRDRSSPAVVQARSEESP